MSFFRRKNKKNKVKSFEGDSHKSLVKKIPNYKGYNDVDDRLDTDKAIRNFLYQQLLEVIDLWTASSSMLMQQQITEGWRNSNLLTSILDKIKKLLIADNIDIYRHSTFFETTDVSEWIDVSIIYTLESEMVFLLDTIKNEIVVINEKLSTPSRLPSKKELTKEVLNLIEKLVSDVNEIYVMISDRAELLASFEIVLF